MRHVQATLESNRWNSGVYTIELNKIRITPRISSLLKFALIVPANIMQKVLSDDLMENTENKQKNNKKTKKQNRVEVENKIKIVKHVEKTCLLVEVAGSADKNISWNKFQSQSKYSDLWIEISKIWYYLLSLLGTSKEQRYICNDICGAHRCSF